MQIFNLLVAVTGGAMSLVVLVVVFIYSLYFDLRPALRDDVPLLLATAVGLALIGAVGTLAAAAHWRSWKAPWRFDVGTVVVSAAVIGTLIQKFSA